MPKPEIKELETRVIHVGKLELRDARGPTAMRARLPEPGFFHARVPARSGNHRPRAMSAMARDTVSDR